MTKTKKILGFIAISIAMFAGMLDSTIVNIALPDITKYFNTALTDSSWISTIYLLSLSVCMITASKIADIVGRKKVMLFGLFVFGVSSALCGMARSLMFLIEMRCIQGIGGAIITPLVIPMALDAFGAEKTTAVGSAIGAITALAAAGGPPLGGLIVEYFKWQWIFYVNVPFVFLAFVLGVFCLRESYDPTASKKLDWFGVAFLSAALFLLCFSLLKGNDYGWKSKTIVFMFIGSAVAFTLFIGTEFKVKFPMMDFSLFRERTFSASVICYSINGFGIACPGLIFNYYLQNVMEYTPLHTALIVMFVALTVIVSMPLGTVFAKRFDARPINFLGILSMACGAFALSKLTVHTSESTMIGIMILFGFAVGFSAQALISCIKHIPEEKSGMGSGIINAGRQIGLCIGIALLVSVLTTHVNNAAAGMKDHVLSAIDSNPTIAQPVKDVMKTDLDSMLSGKNSTNQTELKETLEADIKAAVNGLSAVPAPAGNAVLGKLYDGTAKLNDGANAALNGQQSLNGGIAALSDGLGRLSKGTNTLESGSSQLSAGLTKLKEGAFALSRQTESGSSALLSGIAQLNSGAGAMLSQLSPGTDANKPTVYDAASGLSGGAQKLSGSTDSYVSAVDGTLFAMIKNDPSAPVLLKQYKASLANLQAAYAKASGGQKSQLAQQISPLANLVTLYTVGTDSNVTTQPQFEQALKTLAAGDSQKATVVSSGSQLSQGTRQLSGSSARLASEFAEGGSFKTGMEQLAAGSAKLKQEADAVSGLTGGLNSLETAVSALSGGAEKVSDGARQLKEGLDSSAAGADNLKSGSDKLLSGSEQFKDGAQALENGVGFAGQQAAVDAILSSFSADKDNKSAGAFDSTFLLAAIVLLLVSFFGLFTDRANENRVSVSA